MPRQEEWPELMTPGEVARLMRVDPKTVARWETSGKIKCIRTIGGHRRFRREDIMAMLKPEVTQ